MNRSILIVICDFLLVSLLAFSSIDINNAFKERSAPQIKPVVADVQAESGKDLTAVMRVALEEERKNRDALMGELARSREAATKQQALLAERERQTQTLQGELQSREQEAQKLQQQQANLQEQYASAQTNLQTLAHQLQTSSTEAVISKERLAALEAELRKQTEAAAALQQQMASLARSNQLVLAERQQLAGQLQVAEVEKRHAAEQVVKMEEQVKVEREEKAKLAEGVKVLANQSQDLAREVRENRQLAPNTIFNEFVTNRVQARFDAFRSTVLGIDSSRRKDTETILVTDGTNIFALCHVHDTPLTFFNPGTEWESLSGTLSHNEHQVPIHSLSFCWPDPRAVLMPLSQAESKQLACKVYHISTEPYKFQDAVLVGAREGYYGECRFQIDLSTPDYVKLDNSFLKGLFGKFNPSRGDLVFSKTGELLGLMANNTYCMMIHSFNPTATFQFGPDVRAQHTGDTLARLYSFVAGMPNKLQ
ncbi:MAG: hypothetical protein C5B50_22595 [Verrucomicrobia bacterium]|nr:MAG: hypothetical protein C5B50_22595 [Verrucomicrobiota bacterium]